MSNGLFPIQPSSYPGMSPMIVERTPAGGSIIGLESAKPYSSLVQDNQVTLTTIRPIVLPAPIPSHPHSYYTPIPIKKELDDLAKKQEEFILRCQYPKRILPGELPCDFKKAFYVERKRERSGSPGESRRKSVRQEIYRSYSKSPSRLWRAPRRAERSESRSPRRHPDYSPPGTRSPVVQPESNTLHRNK